MIVFYSALVPIIIPIILGYLLRRSGFLGPEAWSGLEKLTYFVLFPALLIRNIGDQSLAGISWQSILLVVGGTLLLTSALLSTVRKFISQNDATFTSIFQGGVRFNTYIMLAVAQGLFGATGLAVGSVTAGFMIVIINVLCISIFAIWGKSRIRGPLAFVRELIGNPLIIGCLVGWFLNLSGIGLPYNSGNILELIGRAALPIGLLAVGAALKPAHFRSHIAPIISSSIAQFGIKPLIALALIFATGLSGTNGAVLCIAFITPTASSAYILAKQLGGDTDTMASIITIQTILALLIMPTLGYFCLNLVTSM